MGTVVVGAVLVGVVALIVRSMVKDKRNGKSLQCGGDCAHCGGHCSHLRYYLEVLTLIAERAKEYHNFKIKRAWLPDHPAAAHHP